MNIKRISKIGVAAIAGASFAACAGQSGVVPHSSWVANDVRQSALPASCKGQTTSTEFASSPAKLKNRNTHACIPSFGGFGGALHYPAATPAVSATLTSSTTNYNGLLPLLSKGTPMFFLQIATTASTAFASTYKASGGLISKAIKPGKTYFVFGQAKLGGVAGITIDFPPCKATAVKVKGGGAITNLGSVFDGQNIAGSANIVIEIYTKGHVSAKC